MSRYLAATFGALLLAHTDSSAQNLAQHISGAWILSSTETSIDPQLDPLPKTIEIKEVANGRYTITVRQGSHSGANYPLLAYSWLAAIDRPGDAPGMFTIDGDWLAPLRDTAYLPRNAISDWHLALRASISTRGDKLILTAPVAPPLSDLSDLATMQATKRIGSGKTLLLPLQRSTIVWQRVAKVPGEPIER